MSDIPRVKHVYLKHIPTDKIVIFVRREGDFPNGTTYYKINEDSEILNDPDNDFLLI